jgi:long-chain acyl-CoA synthetase
LYEKRPWLRYYSPDVPADVEIPVKSVNEIFDEVTQKWKHKTAIIFYGNEISYQELREKVDRFATGLYHMGIKKGDRVGLLLLNSPEYIIAFYALIKIGAIITPISPAYVSSEIKHQLDDSGTEHIICQDILYEGVKKTELRFKNVILTNIAESLPRIKKMMGQSILKGVYQKMAVPSPKIFEQEGVHQFQGVIKKYPPHPPRIEMNVKEDIILLPYTGGTTGLPKGVLISHYNVIAAFTQYKAFYPALEDGREVIIGMMPFYHAGGQFIIVLSAILSGYTSVILTTPNPDDILSSIIMHKVTVLPGTPALFEILKDYEKAHRVNWKKLRIFSGADALHEDTSKSWETRMGVSIHEIYGMTEFVCLSHATPLERNKLGSMGIPLPSTMAIIADPDKDDFLPLGEIGEIVVNGPQVTKGYWNKPEATKECEALINDLRWWRTGDLGKMEEDGFFYIYDRKRDLIKYKGLRVYAREVEEVLKTHPKIKEVGVVGVKDIKVGEIVKAFVVLESDARGNLSEEDIIEYCYGKLTPYKIPKVVEFVGEIPKTDVGKVSRRELREET